MAKKEAGAGRGFVNPQRTDESDEEYVTPAQRYGMEQQSKTAKDQAATTKAYDKAAGMKKGGSASARADGCCTKGKTKGRLV
jgi:hypothetical protein